MKQKNENMPVVVVVVGGGNIISHSYVKQSFANISSFVGRMLFFCFFLFENYFESPPY